MYGQDGAPTCDGDDVVEHVGSGVQETAAKLRKEDREVGRGRKWRQNYRLLNQEVLLLEEEEKKLELVYPQVGLGTFMNATTIQKLLAALPTLCL